MILRQRVVGLVSIRRDAFRACNVDESVVPRRMGFLGHGMNRFQFRFWIEETLVAAGYVVVNLDAKNTRLLSVGYDFSGIAGCESVGADPHIVSPVLLVCLRSSRCGRKKGKEESRRDCVPVHMSSNSLGTGHSVAGLNAMQ